MDNMVSAPVYQVVDSASVYGAVAALTYGRPEDWTVWTFMSAIEVTAALVFNPSLTFAPSPEPWKRATGLYSVACKHLESILRVPPFPNAEKQRYYHGKVRQWVNDGADHVRNVFKETTEDKGYSQWVEWGLRYAWPEHSSRLIGLFNASFLDEIAAVLGVDRNVLGYVWQKSADPRQVTRWSKGKDHDDDFRLALNAYLVSLLLRGRFHLELAAGEHQLIMQHPIRYRIQEPPRKVETYEVPLAAFCLAGLLTSSAMVERSAEERVSLWAENLLKVRAMVNSQECPDVYDNTPVMERAIGIAEKAARKAEIRVHSRLLERVLQVSLSLGIGGLSSFALSDLSGLLVSLGASEALYRLGGVKWAARRITFTEKRLHDLAAAGAGCLNRIWEGESEQ